MNFYVFRLDDRSSSFRGAVVVFDTDPQQVWRRLTSDEHAVPIEHAVAHNEIAQLRGELETLKENVRVDRGQSLLRVNILNDNEVTHGYRPTFVVRDEFQVIAILPSSFRLRVDTWYERLAADAGAPST